MKLYELLVKLSQTNIVHIQEKNKKPQKIDAVHFAHSQSNADILEKEIEFINIDAKKIYLK